MIADKYKNEADKFKKLLRKFNISVQDTHNYDNYGASSGPRYSHV